MTMFLPELVTMTESLSFEQFLPTDYLFGLRHCLQKEPVKNRLLGFSNTFPTITIILAAWITFIRFISCLLLDYMVLGK